jgi:DNA (cytosine-5)-methyltransferase 1
VVNILKTVELFAGVGSQRMALRNLGIEHEIVAIAEIDKYALQSYEAIHNDCPNLGDISKVNPKDVPEHDLLTYSFPCQDISLAGEMKGLSKGSNTKSSLLWECAKIIEHHNPKYLLLENVKNLVGQSFKDDFDKWLQWLDKKGYVNYWEVLNAKNYGIPQNRDRVFGVGIRKDVNAKRTPYEIGFFDNRTYKFPEPIELKLKLKDLLETTVPPKFWLNEKNIKHMNRKFGSKGKIIKPTDEIVPTLTAAMGNGGGNVPCIEYEIDEKYYLSERIIEGFNKHKKRHEERGNGFKFEPIKNTDTVAKAICTSPGTRATDNYIDESKFEKGGVCGKDYTTNREQEQRLWSENGYSPCITTANTETLKIVTKNKGKRRIRKLTPLECWRLMGFSDEDFKKAKDSGLSDTQLYKQAGNSIVVDVLERIFENLFKI